ncbi:MAG: hypothetical protein KKB50_06635 [Planctomycetes bacterium]|nr:hypothetical protein [Planctomycetota bacterium]
MSRRAVGLGLVAGLVLGWGLHCAAAQTESTPGAAPRQDGRLIPRLEWTAPHGEQPGTYADYVTEHPLRPARFSAQRVWAPFDGAAGPGGRSATDVSILADADLYPQILARFDEYVSDLVAAGYGVYSATVEGGTPADIKAWVQGRYDAGSRGVVFVGDVTAAWAEVSGSVFPSDLFYMDLDGYWADTDQDGDYETHSAGSGDEGPELYVARIYAHSLNYDSEANMVNGYFAKAHAYRAGLLTQPWRGLEYIDDDWYTMDVHLDEVYADDIAHHDFGYETTGADYLNQMDLGQHFVQVCAHSYSGGHHFSWRPTESAVYAHVYVHSPWERDVCLLLGSDDGIKVWLNGDQVCAYNVYQDWILDQWCEYVTLQEGWNSLLCKISQGGGGHEFSARLVDTVFETIPDLEYQLDNPDTHGYESKYIRSWLLNGFHQDSAPNFSNFLSTNYLGTDEATLNPQEGEQAGGQTWTHFASGGDFVDLGQHCGNADYGVCYASARVQADAEKTCQLWLGYDDGARVWLNGSEILYHHRYGGYQADMRKLDLTLTPGENRLLLKISEYSGSHGFGARFCYADGSGVQGLEYDPMPTPTTYVGTWLLNGPYGNADGGTRLSQDYLGGEANVRPSTGDGAPQGTWQRGQRDGCPFDLVAHYNQGDWVFSQTIQDRDPPVLFYNLFACGPGCFTDTNYLAGAYIFNTTYGLITMASSKSGSMLNFHDFTRPLGEGKSVGTAFHDWFDAQAPFELWEREWYYGMILNGDPTLRPMRRGDLNCDGLVNGFDIDAFVLLLNDVEPYDDYYAVYPNCQHMSADVNLDGAVNGFDIDAFVLLLGG